jgi:hypothetical protein
MVRAAGVANISTTAQGLNAFYPDWLIFNAPSVDSGDRPMKIGYLIYDEVLCDYRES